MAIATGEAREAAEARTLRNYVGGRWTDVEGAELLEDRDPATGALHALVPLSGGADVASAVRAAAEALPVWRDVAPQRRARMIMSIREVLWEHREELADLVTADMGKTVDDARGEVLRGIESVEAACAIPHLLKGENLLGVATGVDVEMVRQPVGVVAAITPFNFPAMIPLWFLPFAIACGNTFVLKPSERDPRPAERIIELIDALGELPPGVVNLVHGGREAVNALIDHPDVEAISFVGQASTARHVAQRAAAAGKRFQALGGAKNSIVVMPDADLEAAVPAIMGSAFGAAGQRCLAGSVAVIVGDEARQEEVLHSLAAAAGNLVVGPGGRPEVDVCPLIAPEARERIAAAIDDAAAAGDEVVLDGRRDAGPGGSLIGPSIVAVEDHESLLAREELFGPLLAAVRVSDLQGALRFLNGSRYGNAASIFTGSGVAARAFRAQADAGMLGVNVGVAAPVAWFPFGGWKDSLDGDMHANGTDAVDFYTRKKVITSRWL